MFITGTQRDCSDFRAEKFTCKAFRCLQTGPYYNVNKDNTNSSVSFFAHREKEVTSPSKRH